MNYDSFAVVTDANTDDLVFILALIKYKKPITVIFSGYCGSDMEEFTSFLNHPNIFYYSSGLVIKKRREESDKLIRSDIAKHLGIPLTKNKVEIKNVDLMVDVLFINAPYSKLNIKSKLAIVGDGYNLRNSSVMSIDTDQLIIYNGYRSISGIDDSQLNLGKINTNSDELSALLMPSSIYFAKSQFDSASIHSNNSKSMNEVTEEEIEDIFDKAFDKTKLDYFKFNGKQAVLDVIKGSIKHELSDIISLVLLYPEFKQNLRNCTLTTDKFGLCPIMSDEYTGIKYLKLYNKSELERFLRLIEEVSLDALNLI